jgi:hypothetical protein
MIMGFFDNNERHEKFCSNTNDLLNELEDLIRDIEDFQKIESSDVVEKLFALNWGCRFMPEEYPNGIYFQIVQDTGPGSDYNLFMIQNGSHDKLELFASLKHPRVGKYNKKLEVEFLKLPKYSNKISKVMEDFGVTL